MISMSVWSHLLISMYILKTSGSSEMQFCTPKLFKKCTPKSIRNAPGQEGLERRGAGEVLERCLPACVSFFCSFYSVFLLFPDIFLL